MQATPEQIAAAAAEAAREAEAVMAAARAVAADPTPGPLGLAFDPRPGCAVLARIGLALRPVVASDIPVLKKLDSPIYRQMNANISRIPCDGSAAPVIEPTEEEAVEVVWQFTQPPPRVRAVLARGREAFRETAQAEVADLLGPGELVPAIEAALANFAAAFATQLGHEAPAREGEQRGNFCQGPRPLTASAGGSATSPGCAANTAGGPTT